MKEEAINPTTEPNRLIEIWDADRRYEGELRLLVARNPNTPLALLTRLLKDFSWSRPLMTALGCNPGAPFLLCKAWSIVPESFLQNPVVPLFMLESLPSLPKEMFELLQQRENPDDKIRHRASLLEVC